ncbi:benzoate transporter BenE [Nocardioides marmoriginsengisoli]|uniref:Benzoate transporter BenE n=1 Tax=Nocardioides marmoriginsengisoli TaxID=661483 RepID=A0A3N0CIF2_9ACTN|nr:benzoate/H(+) symporter BenE family transporter [Nocardioides marmoriginsengisoli]RNL63109.1 benzoate transporter BenE [Nocardioides marmoriginsengisoli]
MTADRLQPVLAGVMLALVGFASSFAVVLAGLQAVGATSEQAASGLLALLIAQAVGVIWLSRRHRIPLVLAWSTPGAALLVSSGAVEGGWRAAVGAFLVVGALILLTALWPRLGDLIAAIPTPIAQAMLAGVLLSICVEPVRVLLDRPFLVAPILVVWVVLLRVAPKLAVPGAFVATLVVITGYLVDHGAPDLSLAPQVVWTEPTLNWQAVVGLAVPLYVVTMASQNVPGVAVLATFGYRVPWRESMTVTGLGTAAGAMAGGHAVNLAAITAAMAASPESHPDRDRRWIAAYTSGWAYLVLAAVSTALVGVVSAAPHGLVEVVAGLALLGTLGGALKGATESETGREAAVVTFVVAASGVAFGGVGAAFWALLAGLVVHGVLKLGRPSAPRM